MKILVVVKPGISLAKGIVEKIIDTFGSDSVKVIDVFDIAKDINKKVIECADICIAIGGDGTMLKTVRIVAKYDKPVISVNIGSLGFLSEVAPNELDYALDKIKSGDYSVQERIMLKGYVNSDESKVVLALNELLVHAGRVGSILKMNINVSKICLGTLSADGFIVSTPTGSTAYSLSAGGSILNPMSSVLGLVPVCPHALSFRPLIVPDNEIIEVTCYNDAELIADSVEHIILKPNDKITMQKADISAKFINLHLTTFYDRLRDKLNWGGMK